MSDLNTIFPAVKVLNVGGEELTIRPFTFGQLPKVMAVLTKLSEPASKLYAGNIKDISLISELFASCGEDIIGLMALCLGKPVDFINNLSQDEGIALVTAFIEVNSDFFIQKVLPTVKNQILEKQKVGQK